MAVYRQESYLDRIKAIKSERKITNDKLAGMTGIPLGTLKLLAGISDSPSSQYRCHQRGVDCSLDYLITGVPRNTNNCTLSEDELMFIGNYRLLDGYGRSLVDAVVNMEVDRAIRQQTDDAHRNVSPQGDAGEQAAYPASAARHRTLRSGQDELSATAPAELPPQSPEPPRCSTSRADTAGRTPPSVAASRCTICRCPPVSGIPVRCARDRNQHPGCRADGGCRLRSAYRRRQHGAETTYDGDILLVRRTESVTPGELGIFCWTDAATSRSSTAIACSRSTRLPAHPAEEFHADCLLRSGHRADAGSGNMVPNGSQQFPNANHAPVPSPRRRKGQGRIIWCETVLIGSRPNRRYQLPVAPPLTGSP